MYIFVERTIGSYSVFASSHTALSQVLIQRCRFLSHSVVVVSHTALSLFLIQRCAVHHTALSLFPVFSLFSSMNPESCLEEQNLLNSVCASNTDTWKHFLSFPFPTMKFSTRWASCLNETAVFQSLVAYVSAEGRDQLVCPLSSGNAAFICTMIYQRPVIVWRLKLRSLNPRPSFGGPLFPKMEPTNSMMYIVPTLLDAKTSSGVYVDHGLVSVRFMCIHWPGRAPIVIDKLPASHVSKWTHPTVFSF